ncbi:hypothetical protein GCM10017744_102280 [Streptomyces antimycoticus]|uniref:Uncharacterized protein n=1 Tax=Streptomyces antimycoticus TaxID=68175 RepID=A0A4D4KJD5_9ACTN|nr:hypothetical protein [Streptomyces antimycoticus]GDY49261.1 hypothetical protein SANT12839_101430 [Streptomyces antimycoticus]
MTDERTGPSAGRLDADEERVTRAWHLLVGLGAALVHRPFNPVTYQALRDYLDRDADEVLASLTVLLERPENQLRERIAELTRPVPAAENGGRS